MSAYITQTPAHPWALEYILGFVEVNGVSFWDHAGWLEQTLYSLFTYLDHIYGKASSAALEKEVQYSSNRGFHGNASLRTGLYWQLILIVYTVLNIIKSKKTKQVPAI